MKNFSNKTYLITGGTGFIGSALIKRLSSKNKILCLTRNPDKISGENITAITDLKEISDPIDFIIHCACPTASSELANNSIEVIDTIYELTKSCLELSIKNNARMLFLSSMEVYGKTEGLVEENDLGYLDLSSPRNGYAEAKRLAELMCHSYNAEHNANVVIARLAQIFGPGCKKDDSRFFNYVIKKIVANEDIILNSDGTTYHNSCYLDDAIDSLLAILFSDKKETFNISNPEYTMSINELCERIIAILKSDVKLIHNVSEKTNFRTPAKYTIDNKKITSVFNELKYTSFENAIKETFNYLRTL